MYTVIFGNIRPLKDFAKNVLLKVSLISESRFFEMILSPMPPPSLYDKVPCGFRYNNYDLVYIFLTRMVGDILLYILYYFPNCYYLFSHSLALKLWVLL